ncbi:hypothetical protein [Naasia aerilata]|uniref:DUF4157 domain-containing protein n=1 Tax=Naasia aerilata TaxID=1162966 RepID=A0ABN6XQ95_9MICO|nr:hypothetical protein [Naasia aerilata]BDZ47185.1 hypothetical protein GCM10025866_30940 [Naasia aerilata]
MTARIDPKRYLQLGGVAPAHSFNGSTTLAYLQSKGFGDNYLEQSRVAVGRGAGQDFVFEPGTANYCDFCARPLMGGEFDLLQDGRERCVTCSRTAVTTHEEFVLLYQEVRRNLEVIFEIQFNVGITVRMENAKTIARRTNERFEPTAGFDPRVLGFGSKTANGYELYIENGSPKLPSIQTMAHELTHIWQFRNWDESAIHAKYGARNHLFIYEGMASWAMIQYLYSTKETDFASREAAHTRARQDEYGAGFRLFEERYPIRVDGRVLRETPFKHKLPL